MSLYYFSRIKLFSLLPFFSVEPKDLRISCSGQLDGIAEEDCSHFKMDAVKSIKCQAFSNPRSIIVWSSKVDDCETESDGMSKSTEAGYLQSDVLRPVCQGEYCCVAKYDQSKQVFKVCQTLGNTTRPPPKGNCICGK